MAIRLSAAREIDSLLGDLASSNAVRRDAAIARLSVIGSRAVARLSTLAVESQTPPATRLAALRALDGIGDPLAFDPAIDAIASSDPDVVLAGIAVLRRLLKGPRETAAIETLTSIALNTTRPPAPRIAAAEALSALGSRALKPLQARLESDADAEVRHWAATRTTARAGRETAASVTLEALIEGGLPDDPGRVKAAIGRSGRSTSLTVLRRAIEAIREREDRVPARSRAEWMAARAAVHVALADRVSRVALYDLRDSLATATTPLPVEFLAAVTKIGDATCLEPLAAAYARSTRSGETWWRQHLRHAFHTIVMRDRITRRHAAMKKVLARWPAIVQ